MRVAAMNDDVQRDLGRIEARLDAGDERMNRIEQKIDSLTTKLDELSAFANRTKGAWGLLLAAGATGAALIEIIRAIFHKGP
jgi:hypothetical protein